MRVATTTTTLSAHAHPKQYPLSRFLPRPLQPFPALEPEGDRYSRAAAAAHHHVPRRLPLMFMVYFIVKIQ
jgi:hypothetical protein